MRRALTLSITLMFMLAFSAHARKTTMFPLTHSFIGYWCQSQEQHFGETVYQRGASDCDGNLTFEYDHYDADFWDGKNACRYLDIYPTNKNEVGYLVRVDCVSNKNIWSQETVKLRTVDDLLPCKRSISARRIPAAALPIRLTAFFICKTKKDLTLSRQNYCRAPDLELSTKASMDGELRSRRTVPI